MVCQRKQHFRVGAAHGLMTVDPFKRLTAHEALSHPWLQAPGLPFGASDGARGAAWIPIGTVGLDNSKQLQASENVHALLLFQSPSFRRVDTWGNQFVVLHLDASYPPDKSEKLGRCHRLLWEPYIAPFHFFNSGLPPNPLE